MYLNQLLLAFPLVVPRCLIPMRSHQLSCKGHACRSKGQGGVRPLAWEVVSHGRGGALGGLVCSGSGERPSDTSACCSSPKVSFLHGSQYAVYQWPWASGGPGCSTLTTWVSGGGGGGQEPLKHPMGLVCGPQTTLRRLR